MPRRRPRARPWGKCRDALADGDELIGSPEDEVENVADRTIERVVANHGHVVTTRTLDEVILDLADLREGVEVLLERTQPFGRVVPDPEVTAVQVLVLDRHDALHDERAGVVRPD